jgi:hypothetical protein
MTDETNTAADVADEAAAVAAPGETSIVTAGDSDDSGSVDTGGTDTGTTGDDDTNDDSSQAAPVDGYADFNTLEGVELDSALLEKATPVFKDLGLTQEQAQKLVDFQAENVQAGATAQVEAFNQMVDGWATESKNDSEFGGDKFEESVAIAQAAVNKFGTPAFKELMETHGVGNHPEVIRFMVKVGSLTMEDSPGSVGSQSQETPDHATILYGK